MILTELLQRRGLEIEDVDFISVSRQGFLVSTFPKSLFPYLEYDGRLMELSLRIPDFDNRIYWCIDEININQKIHLTRENKEKLING